MQKQTMDFQKMEDNTAQEVPVEGTCTDYIYMVTNDKLIISMNAELDHHLADEMRDVIDQVIDARNVRYLIFDFSKIGFMDSAGIGLIMGRYKKLRDCGQIFVTGINESIERILLISGLHKLIVQCKDIYEACHWIDGKKNNRATKSVGQRKNCCAGSVIDGRKNEGGEE